MFGRWLQPEKWLNLYSYTMTVTIFLSMVCFDDVRGNFFSKVTRVKQNIYKPIDPSDFGYEFNGKCDIKYSFILCIEIINYVLF